MGTATQLTRQELFDITLDFTEALLQNEPERIKLAPGCKCTYNGVQHPLGSQGDVWGLPRRMPYRQTFADPEQNSVMFLGTVTNVINFGVAPVGKYSNSNQNQKWWIYILRIVASHEGLLEVEEVVRDNTQANFTTLPEDIQPDRIVEIPLLEYEKSTREEMINITNKYWDGCNKCIKAEEIPYHPDCRRLELGSFLTDSRNFPDSIRNTHNQEYFYWDVIRRRFPIVDVDHGIVISMVSMISPHDEFDQPSGYITDLFKIVDGRIKYVFAFYCGQIEEVDWEGRGPQRSAP